MDSASFNSLLTNGEFVIWLTAFGAAAYAKLYRNFAAVLCFLGVKTLTAGAYSLLMLYHLSNPAAAVSMYHVFFVFYWITYSLATTAVFFSIEQIIRRVLAPLAGLARLGVLIFRFTGGLTLFIALTSHVSELRSVSHEVWLRALFVSFGLCMCVFEISLMGLLTATAHRLGLSLRTRIFGLSLGFCFLGIMDFVSLAAANASSQWAQLGMTSELVVFGTLLMWTGYFLLPDQQRGTLKLPDSSTLMRWNEIVKQLGPESQVTQAPGASFMQEVERIVEEIVLRNQSRRLRP